MQRIKQVCLLVTVAACFAMSDKKDNTVGYEGILYTDHSPVRIEVTNGKISAIKKISASSAKNIKLFIAPGLIDNQVNGYAGVTFSQGDASFTEEDVLKVTRALWKEGVTTFLPTLRTNDQQYLIRNLKVLAKAKLNPALHGSIAGFHLEGPYISKEDGYRGAHALKYVRDANQASFMELYNASSQNILQVTLAPEAPGAMEFIRMCRQKNIVAAIGHHNASAALIAQAIDNGAKIATHLGNALANQISRRDNPLWPQLSDDRLMISIICDGFHLLPEQVRVFYKVKGVTRTIITSDVDKYAGMQPGKYLNAEGDTIQLTTEGAVMYVARNSLSGSASPITKGVGNIMKFTGCSMGDAFTMGATNAARLYGLTDRGELKVGMRADLILFTMDDQKINIKKTIVQGDPVYDAK